MTGARGRKAQARLEAGTKSAREIGAARRRGGGGEMGTDQKGGPMARPNRSDRSNVVRVDFSTNVSPAADEEPLNPMEGLDLDATDRMYVVEEGDTLTSIARKFYGNASARRRIFVANSRVILDPFVIEPGTRLRIPN